MRLRVLYPALGLLCFGTVLLLVLRTEPVLLRWKLSRNQVFRYRTTYSMGGTTTNETQDRPTGGEYSTYHSVLEVGPEGVATIFMAESGPVTKQTVSRFKVRPMENPYQMTPRGQEVRDIEVYRREFRRVMQEWPDSEMRRFLESNEERDVAQYEAAKSLEDFVLPEKPVRPGDEWTNFATLKNERGTFQTVHRYRLKSVDAGMATILMDQSEAMVPGSGTEFGETMKISQVLTREARFSIEKGLLVDLREQKKNTFILTGGKVSTTIITTQKTLIEP